MKTFTFCEMILAADGTISATGRRWTYLAADRDEAVAMALYYARLNHPEAEIAPSGRGIIVTTTADGAHVNWYECPGD